MEKSSGAALFTKVGRRLELTVAGEDVVAVAAQVEGLTHDLDARITGRDAKLEGSIRVTSVESVLRLWMPDFAEFRRRHPGIDLQLLSGLEVANLTQREADGQAYGGDWLRERNAREQLAEARFTLDAHEVATV